MAGNVSRYQFIIEALRFKLKNRADKRLTQYNGWFYEGKNGIFDVARRNFPQFYRQQFPQETTEGNLNYAQLLVANLDNRRDTTLLEYFQKDSAPLLDPKTAQQIDEAIKAKAPEPVAVGAGQKSSSPPARPTPPKISIRPLTEKEQEETTTQEPLAETDQAAAVKEAERIVSIKPALPYSVANTAKNFGSSSGRIFYKNIGSKLSLGSLGRGVSGLLGGLGKGTGGVIGGGLSASAPFLSRAGHGLINAGLKLTTPASGIGGPKLFSPGKKFLVGALIGFGAFFGISLISALFNPAATPSGSASALGATDLVSCQFTRGDRNPPAESYNSPVLLSYFQEAERLTSVPASLLAAIARVESPTVTRKADADLPQLNSIQGCPRSPTGALGIMQLQPPGTRGHFAPGLEQGAKFLNKSLGELTEADFCDVRTSIILSAGFILKKLELGYGIGDGTSWNTSWNNDQNIIYKVASGYYGCLEYGGGDPLECSGPYNYGSDLWTSIQSCKSSTLASVSTLAGSCPVLGGKISTPSYQADPLNGHCGGSYGYTCRCGTEGRRAKAVDVPTQGKDVLLPFLEGQSVKWKLIVGPYPIDNSEGGGSGYTFETTLGNDKYYLDMLHLSSLNPSVSGEYVSGVPITKSVAGHVHLTIGKNIQNPTSPGSNSTDCDSGWLPSDFLCR